MRTLRALLTGLLLGIAPTAVGQEIENHQTAGVVDLVPGAARGTITQPLVSGVLASSGAEVLFVVTDASDADFADMFGAIRADSLAEAPDAAVEIATFVGGTFIFEEDPGLVARFDVNDEDGDGDVTEVLPPAGNLNYSPLKRIVWEGQEITVNAPFVKWGDGPGQQLLVDHGGCDPLIRSNPPSPFFVGNGPTNGTDCSTEAPLDRYKGGQAVDLDLDAMTVTMKLHKATFSHPKDIPYYTVFDASKPPPAGFMGVIHAPRLGNLGRLGDNDAVGRIAQFSNGVRLDAGGPNRFQQGITSYRGGQQGTYSPMWHITWIFFDCDGDGVFFDAAHNVGEGAVPMAGSGIPGFDPADPATFDPFGMDDKGVSCMEFAISVTGNADGFIEDLGHLDALIDDGVAIQTEGPAGLRLDSPLQPPLIVNCPVPLTVRGHEDKSLPPVEQTLDSQRGPGDPFRRGDSDGNGVFDITDPLFILGCEFLGTECTSCPDAADTNDDGTVDITDAISLLSWRFVGGPSPSDPGTSCGFDRTEDGLGACRYSACHGKLPPSSR